MRGFNHTFMINDYSNNLIRMSVEITEKKKLLIRTVAYFQLNSFQLILENPVRLFKHNHK